MRFLVVLRFVVFFAAFLTVFFFAAGLRFAVFFAAFFFAAIGILEFTTTDHVDPRFAQTFLCYARMCSICIIARARIFCACKTRAVDNFPKTVFSF